MPEELYADLVSAEWVDERKKRWGVNSPIYTSKFLGEIPDISDDTLIMPKWIEPTKLDPSTVTGAHTWLWMSPATARTRRSSCTGQAGWARVYRAHTKTAR